jgi:hypothetical protein
MRYLLLITALILLSTSSASAQTSDSSNMIEFTPVFVILGYNGAYGCSWPLDQNAFDQAIQRLKNIESSSDRLAETRKFADGNCLLTDQVVALLNIMGSDKARLEIGKICYSGTYDIDDFSKAYDAFSSASKRSQLEEYVQSKKTP